MFPPKRLFFTKTFTHLFYPQFTFLWYDTPGACMAKISSEPPCMAGHSIPIIHINVRKKKIRLEGTYSYCFFPLLISLCTRTRFIFSFLMHTHKVCIWKENILFSFISYAQAHDLAFFFWNNTLSPASIFHATGVHCPCHQDPGLSTRTPSHRRPSPPPCDSEPPELNRLNCANHYLKGHIS